MEISQPASAGDSRYRNFISIESITTRHSAARSAGCELPGYQPGVPLRSTPGFMLPPASQVGSISSSNSRDATLGPGPLPKGEGVIYKLLAYLAALTIILICA